MRTRPLSPFSWVLVAALVGCSGDDPTDTGPTETETETETDTVPTDTTTATTGETGTTVAPTGDTAPPEPPVDCAAVPAAPTGITQLVAPRGYHDVAFDPDGNLIGSDNNVLFKARTDGTRTIWVPGLGVVQQMDWLHDGDLVVASDQTSALIRVNAAGGTSPLATDVGAYGVIVGPDGMVYTANYDRVQRIDPATGNKTTLVDYAGLSPRVINFSPDFTKLYIGTISGNGNIYAVDLDVNLDPTGPPYVFATGVGTGSYHDTLGVDVCGNLYVADYSTNNMYRITPGGASSLYINFPFSSYAHGMEWGSGIDGWREDAIYVSQPYNSNNVAEIVIGVESAHKPYWMTSGTGTTTTDTGP